MTVYHWTPDPSRILTADFRDTTSNITDPPLKGVWLSNVPLVDRKGAALLALKIPARILAKYEWREPGKNHREFCVPADVVNRYGPPMVVQC